MLTKELLCPTFIENDNEEEFITYASKLYETLLSKPKTFKPWKWWSLEVVQLLLKFGNFFCLRQEKKLVSVFIRFTYEMVPGIQH